MISYSINVPDDILGPGKEEHLSRPIKTFHLIIECEDGTGYSLTGSPLKRPRDLLKELAAAPKTKRTLRRS